MAEEERKSQSQPQTPVRSTQSSSQEKRGKNLKVELLANSWERLSDDGKTTTGRYRRGAVIEDVPESVVKSLNSGFKPAFRVLED